MCYLDQIRPASDIQYDAMEYLTELLEKTDDLNNELDHLPPH